MTNFVSKWIVVLYIRYLKKSNSSTISLCFLYSRRAEEPAIFLATPAPAPHFFSKRLRLRLLFFFSNWLRLPSPGAQVLHCNASLYVCMYMCIRVCSCNCINNLFNCFHSLCSWRYAHGMARLAWRPGMQKFFKVLHHHEDQG